VIIINVSTARLKCVRSRGGNRSSEPDRTGSLKWRVSETLSFLTNDSLNDSNWIITCNKVIKTDTVLPEFFQKEWQIENQIHCRPVILLSIVAPVHISKCCQTFMFSFGLLGNLITGCANFAFWLLIYNLFLHLIDKCDILLFIMIRWNKVAC